MPKWVGLWVAVGAALVGTSAFAGATVEYAPPAEWVRSLPIPAVDTVPDAGAIQVLLQSEQSRYVGDADEFYSERVLRIRTPEGLTAGNVIESWNPETETLIVHRLHIIRDGATIDILANGRKLTVLRRETNLEAAALDGALTATIQPEDVRVGDILDYAFTLKRKDPLRAGHSEGFSRIGYPGVAGRIYIRHVWKDTKPIRWRATEALPAPVVAKAAAQTELLIDVEKTSAPKAPLGAPARYAQLGQLEVTQFRDWAEISSLMAPLYDKASLLSAKSPVKLEAARIGMLFPDPKSRALAALKLVQDQTRYVFLGMNQGGYMPANADVTWSRRFGDCKAKTALLLALLKQLGIDAEPVFVSSSGGDGMDQRLPMLTLFDHVLVRASIDGKAYWLDGTRRGDLKLDDIPIPGFRWGLPVQASGAQLTAIVQQPFLVPQSERTITMDVRGGLDRPAIVHAEQVYRGDASIVAHFALDEVGASDRDRALREFWSREYSWVKASSVGSSYDSATGVTRFWLNGAGLLEAYSNGPVKDYRIDDSAIGGSSNYQREPGPNQDAPYAVDFPDYSRHSVMLLLPSGGAGFVLFNADEVNGTVGGVWYRRHAQLRNGIVLVDTEIRGMTPDFPATEAEAAANILRNWGDHDVVLRADATPAVAPAAPKPGPHSAAEFAAAGMSILADNPQKAVDAFSRAIALNPGSAKYLYDRGVAHFRKRDDALALADFDQVLTLEPDNIQALMARAEVNLFLGKSEAAGADFERAFKLRPGDRILLQRRANAYREADLLDVAAGYYADWLQTFPADKDADQVRGELCLVRAARAATSDKALEDCVQVLEKKPRDPFALRGIALIHLRRKNFVQAAADFDAVLSGDPDSAEGLYGRGLAKTGLGFRLEAQADISAAKTVDPQVESDFKDYGLAP